ncbi:GRAM-domain-containing protein [Marasmius fiardii PR-910]|nr:GRAM-domain-containing protein [Marasmius fiardii PR-910]
MNTHSGFSDLDYSAPGQRLGIEINQHSHIPSPPPTPTPSTSYAPDHGYQVYSRQHQDYVPYIRPSVISAAGRRRSSSGVLHVITRQPVITTGDDHSGKEKGRADEGSLSGNKKRLRRTNSLGDEPCSEIDRETGSVSGSGVVAGPVVASSRRNAEFHELFPDVPEGDYLIDDYICSLERVILIQGRLYISENYVSFYSNNNGWITQLSFALLDIVSLKKTPYDSLYITTTALEHKLVSFLARDTAYDVLDDTWRRARSRGDIEARYEGM